MAPPCCAAGPATAALAPDEGEPDVEPREPADGRQAEVPVEGAYLETQEQGAREREIKGDQRRDMDEDSQSPAAPNTAAARLSSVRNEDMSPPR